MAVHAFITSKLVYCNSLLYGCREMQLKKHQYVQNTAARIVTQTGKFDHIMPVLFDLHWLHVSCYIFVFKIFSPVLADRLSYQSYSRNWQFALKQLLEQP